MVKTTSKKILVKASADKPSGKPLLRNKTPRLEPEIYFYALEDSDETAEGEESEMLVVHNSSLAVSKQNIVKRKFPYIDTFDHERTAVVNAMRDLTIGVFEHLDIPSHMDMDQRVAYTQRIIVVSALKNYKSVLVECKPLENYIVGYTWDLVLLKEISTEYFWTWTKKDGIGYDEYSYLGLDKCIDFDNKLRFELGKCVCRKYQSVYQDHLKYVRNDIVKPLCVGILCYAEPVVEMHYLEYYLPPP